MSDQVQNNVNGSNPLSESYRLKYVEEENRALRDELAAMKQLFQQVSMQSGAPPTSTKSSPAPASPAPRKSLTSKQLADLKRANAGHDLDKVDLDGVGNKLLTSCYNLACCLMNSALATSLVPSSPSITERQKIEGFFDVSPMPPSDSAGHQIQLQDVRQIQANSKIDNDYVQYIHATMKRWGISRFTMDWDKHWDNCFNQIMSSLQELASVLQAWKKGRRSIELGSGSKYQAAKLTLLARQLYLQQQGVHLRFINPFNDKDMNSEDELSEENEGLERYSSIPYTKNNPASLLVQQQECKRLEMAPPIFEMIDDFNYILPQDDENFHIHATRARIELVNESSKDGDSEEEEDKGEFEESFIVKMVEDEEEL
ncbi:hypothetical protein PSTT_06938 [Puccinia striiformis]|uniref:Uncharacterized protein n=2 Tax=Puccinia striiformis TaxID=27350 RepID=A0A2S4VIC1_9BASI|nr:hypothetical protein PSTT_06938 [Puccinia striiformis]